MKKVNSILIVDDNEADREWCRMVLDRSQRFCHILSSESGMDAIRLLKQFEAGQHTLEDNALPLAVILLDINMHGMNGFEFMEAFDMLQSRSHVSSLKTTTVIMVSSSENPGDKQRAMDFPTVRDFITKPMSKKEAHTIADQFGSESFVP